MLNRLEVGSLSDANQFSFDKMHRFLFNTYNIQESVITGSEWFPGELLPSQWQKLIIPADLLDLLVEYYTAAYENLSFRKPFADSLDNSIIVLN